MSGGARRRGVGYTLGFAAVVCLACSIVVSTAAVVLRPAQERAVSLDRQRRVLAVAGLVGEGERPPDADVVRMFRARVAPEVVELATGRLRSDIDASTFDADRTARDPATSRVAPVNAAGITRLERHALVYLVHDDDGRTRSLVLPVRGRGLWSTLRGYLALEVDGVTIRGLTFYDHAETPGLGGEIESPRWRAAWRGRRAYDEAGGVAIEVARGRAGPPDVDPYRVDGISGATLTGDGVTELLRFWLGPNGFGPYLAARREPTS